MMRHKIESVGGLVHINVEFAAHDIPRGVVALVAKCKKEIEDALIPERREGQDEKGEHPEGTAPMGERRK